MISSNSFGPLFVSISFYFEGDGCADTRRAVLAMGGIALGKAVDSSGLLNVMDDLIRDMINGLTLAGVVAVLSVVVLVRPYPSFPSYTI